MTRPRVADRIAVVVGGGRGIGQASALRLARDGTIVHIADASETAAIDTAEKIRRQGGRAEGSAVDLSDASAVGRYFYRLREQHGRIEVLVICPAHASDTHVEQMTEKEWDTDIAVTLKTPFLCIQAALPALLAAAGRAAVVSIGSINGLQAFGNEAYGAAEAGLVNLHQNLALRYGPRGVRFNVVAAGTVHTDGWEARLASEPQMLDEIARLYPLRRVGTVDDLAAAVAFLASADAAWITGSVLTVDGGITAGHGEFMASTFGERFFSSTVGERPRT